MKKWLIVEKWEPKIAAFLCNWCSYAGADLAGTSRIQYHAQYPYCSGTLFGTGQSVFYPGKAFNRAWTGCWLGGCHPGECHYLTGNYSARRKFALIKNMLEFIGLEAGRVHFTWVSASEGVKFAHVIEAVTEKVTALGPATRLVKRSCSEV